MIAGVDHIGIAVHSIEEARRFWEDLGLEVAAIEEVAEEGVRVAMLPVGGTRIELLEPTREDSAIARFLATRGPGIHHVCMASDDVDDDDASLRAKGHRLIRDAPSPGAGGSRVQFIHPKSAGGVLVELAEHAAGGHAP
ncbi:MAG: methylmalonyl-CoA epimerase [Acidobacteria bacterium]|nr:MAG: methylmalonyl-CoA epimerase [Acidobacteriota bacterium]REK11669.1 MAG: methylmalonyl-CoA epimerase [Acidobacteriota bacterium]